MPFSAEPTRQAVRGPVSSSICKSGTLIQGLPGRPPWSEARSRRSSCRTSFLVARNPGLQGVPVRNFPDHVAQGIHLGHSRHLPETRPFPERPASRSCRTCFPNGVADAVANNERRVGIEWSFHDKIYRTYLSRFFEHDAGIAPRRSRRRIFQHDTPVPWLSRPLPTRNRF